MARGKWLACLALSTIAAGAVGCATGSEGEADAVGSGGGGGASAPAGCSQTDPCKPGSVCHNGACAKGCNVDPDCDESEYCSRDLGQICQPRVVSSCPSTPCAPTQVCVNGMCGIQTGVPCGPNPFDPSGDGCPKDEMCLAQVTVEGVMIEARQCYALPSCTPELTCPVGSKGGLCTYGLYEQKDAFCIPGVCLGSEHCPQAFACVYGNTVEMTGRCSDGLSGSLCGTNADCTGSPCLILTPGLLGNCQ